MLIYVCKDIQQLLHNQEGEWVRLLQGEAPSLPATRLGVLKLTTCSLHGLVLQVV